MKDFRKLKVWEKAHHLALDTYRYTATFPREERYGLTSQMRRCASSIPSNIAEGCGSGSDADFARFLQIALRSASEFEYQALLAHELNYLDEANFEASTHRTREVKRMLSGLLKRLNG